MGCTDRVYDCAVLESCWTLREALERYWVYCFNVIAEAVPNCTKALRKKQEDIRERNKDCRLYYHCILCRDMAISVGEVEACQQVQMFLLLSTQAGWRSWRLIFNSDGSYGFFREVKKLFRWRTIQKQSSRSCTIWNKEFSYLYGWTAFCRIGFISAVFVSCLEQQIVHQ